MLLSVIAYSQKMDSNGSQFYMDSIFSHSLNEYRKMNVYLPIGYIENEAYPIIYATDGSLISKTKSSQYKLILDSLIENELIPPVIYVESHSNLKRVGETFYLDNGDSISWQYRNYEFREQMSLESRDSVLHQRFDRHLIYFTEELIPSIEKQFSLPNAQKNRYFYGYSNGGGFGVNLAFKRPELISTYLCFSTFGSNIERMIVDNKIGYPSIYLEYGNQESIRFQDESVLISEKCKMLNMFYRLNKYNGDHDEHCWELEFTKTLIEIFNK